MAISRKKQIQPDDKTYNALLRDVSSIYEQTILQMEKEQSHGKIESYWQIGKRILESVTQGSESGAYGKQLISKLSDDLTAKYGQGFKRRNVNYIRSFALHYTDTDFQPQLSWSHYRALLSIRDDEQRNQLEARAIKENLGVSDLEQLIRQQKPTSKRRNLSFSLIPRQAEPGIVKLVADTLNPNGPPLLDLGFNVRRPANIAAIIRQPVGTYLQAQANGKFNPISCTPGMRYCYRAHLLDVIDGDTIRVRLYLGWSTVIDEKLRLRGVDAMEINTPEGKKAKRGLSKMLADCDTLTILTYGNDRYGRYVADVITAEGAYINKELVDNGFAAFVKM